MSDITQKLGFDVSQAINNLNSLNQAIAQHSKVLTQLQTHYNAFNGLTSPLQQLNAATARTTSSIGNSLKQFNGATSSVNAMSTALNSLTGRIVFANLISRGATEVRESFVNAAREAVEFQRTLARIQTIAPGLRGNLDTLAESVVALSNEFNQPLNDTALGLYQTISNQIEGTAAQFNVLSSSMKLGKVVSASTEDAVDLLTASIVGFSQNVEDADDISAKWFRTIDLGRLVASEVSNSIGRLAKLSTEVGVSMEEVQAALATISKSGVKTSEAITQVRATLTGLIKPSQTLQEALNDLGYTSGQQAVQLNGFSGTLVKLIDYSNGSAAALGKLFPNVRNLTGVLNAASDGAKGLNADLNEIKNTTAADFQTAYKLVIETDAEKATKTLNQLKNFLTNDVGTAALKAFNSANQSVQSFDQTLAKAGDSLERTIGFTPRLVTLEDAFIGIVSSLPAATAALLSYTAATRGADLVTRNFGASAGSVATKVGLVGTLVFGAVSSINAFEAAVQNQLDRALQNYEKSIRDKVQLVGQQNREITRAEQQLWDDLTKRTQEGIRGQLTEFQKGNFAIRDEQVQLAKSLTNAITGVFEARKSLIVDLNNAATNSAKEATDATEAASKSQIQTEDTLFQRRLRNVQTQEQFNVVLGRATKLGKQASEALKNATNPDDRKTSDELFQRAFALEQQAFAIADQSKNTADMQQAEAILAKLTRDRSAALTQYAATQSRVSREATLEAQNQQDALKQLQERFKSLGDGPQLFDAFDNLLPKDARTKNIDKFRQQFAAFEREALGKGLDLGTFIDLQKLKAEVNRNLSASEVTALNFAPSAFDDFNKKLNTNLDSFFANKDVKLIVDVVLSANGKQVTDPAELFGDFQTLGSNSIEAGKLRSQIQQLTTQVTSQTKGAVATIEGALIETSGRQLSEALAQFQMAYKSITGGVSPKNDVASDPFNAAFNSIKAAAEDGKVSVKEFETAVEAVSKAVAAFNSADNTGFNVLKQDIEALETARDALSRALDNTNQISELQQQLDALNVPATSLQQTLQSIAPAVNSGFDSVRAGIQDANSAASQLLNALSNTPKAVSRFNGGLLYRAGGGAARGLDQIPAMLSPGEFVINSRSATKFAPQLRALNAGIEPSYRSSGGNTYQTFGDVVVNSEGRDPGSTGRKIAQSLRREMRRGTTRLN